MTTTTNPSQPSNSSFRTIFNFSLPAIIVVYWAVFWLLNAADKILNRTSLEFFTWHGKDRTAQFSQYFTDMNMPLVLVEPTLYFAFVWELVVGILFMMAISRPQLLSKAFALSAITFIGFSAFDVIAGDRAELLEHGTYMALLLVSWKVLNREP